MSEPEVPLGASESASLLRKAFDDSPIGMVVVGREARLLRTNAAFRELYGWTGEDATGAAVPDLIHPDDRVRVVAEMEALLGGLVPRIRVEHRAALESGELLWVEVTASRLNDDPDAPLLLAQILDVTDRHRARREIDRREQLLLDAQELAQVGSYEWEVTAARPRWSPMMYRILGIEPGAVEPGIDEFLARVHPDDRARFERDVLDMMATRRPWSTSFRLVRASGEVRVVEWKARVEVDADGEIARVVGMAQDVTERGGDAGSAGGT